MELHISPRNNDIAENVGGLANFQLGQVFASVIHHSFASGAAGGVFSAAGAQLKITGPRLRKTPQAVAAAFPTGTPFSQRTCVVSVNRVVRTFDTGL